MTQSITKFARIIAEAVSAWKVTKNISKGVKRAHDIAGLRQKLQRIKSLGRKDKTEQPPLGTGVQRVDEMPLTVSRTQIERKFDSHAKDFGVTEPRGRTGFAEFERAIRSQIDDPSTMHINGTYRGDAAIINYNPDSGLAVIQKPSGEFISGWRLSPEQIANVTQRGSLR